jgi:ATP-dependent Clp protease ATP-binding subunit ClpA
MIAITVHDRNAESGDCEGCGMYEPFTDRAWKVMRLANQEAQRYNIGTEHILLGLVKEGEGVAAHVLKALGIDLRQVRREVDKVVAPGPDEIISTGKRSQTPRARKVIEFAIEESRNLNHNYLGTEHLLLGLLGVEDGVAAQVLMNIGLRLEDVREEIMNLLGVSHPSARAGSPFMGLRSLPAAEFPADLRPALMELATPIEALTQEKEEAIAEQDFETAVRLRDQADKLVKQKEAILRAWRTKHLPDLAWLSSYDGAVAALARTIAEEGRWGDLPVLADALEEAGCTDREMLSHCREGGEHERGCWVVALLLGKC